MSASAVGQRPALRGVMTSTVHEKARRRGRCARRERRCNLGGPVMRRVVVVTVSFALFGVAAWAWAASLPDHARLAEAGASAAAAPATIKPSKPTIVDK